MLFQIVDDILDVTGSDETLGKPRAAMSDLGKRTYVSEFGLDGARELAAESHRRALAALAAGGAGGIQQPSFGRSPTSSRPDPSE